MCRKIRGGIALSRIRGSKYVQSRLDNCFEEIKEYLLQERDVCFVGTTCQVNGLKAFLKTEQEHLITVDLVCHGTPSPKLWRKYLEYQKSKYHSEIKTISFRNKTYGYHSGTMKIEFDNGKTYYGSARVDYMLKSFFKEIASRPSCYQCSFKTLNRCSDFTVFDCWHANQLVNGLKDDDCGYTNLIVQSEKGKKVMGQIKKYYDIYPIDMLNAVKLDGVMVLNSANAHPKRNEYYINLDTENLPKHVGRYIPITLIDHVLEKSKYFLYRLGILRTLKKRKR